MSDRFETRVQSAAVLRDDVLTTNMEVDSIEADRVPVLFDDAVYYFHDITGGYDPDAGEYLVTLIHEVQGPGSPPDNPRATSVEVHTDSWCYTLSVTDAIYWDEAYPEDDYAITLHVAEYETSPYTFAEKLRIEIDRREQEHSYE